MNSDAENRMMMDEHMEDFKNYDTTDYEEDSEYYGGISTDADEGSYAQSRYPQPDAHVGKPQVWVRVRPSPCTNYNNSVFEIKEDNKVLRFIVKPDDRLLQRKTGKTASFKFFTDGIMQNAGQKEIYESTVQEVVQKAMEGVSGVVICVGPESSGKSYTMFGPPTTYQLRGILPRALEQIFQMVDSKKGSMEFHLIFSMFEIRKDRIKDLLTLAPWELKRVGDFGPMGLFMEEITSIEKAISLILRGTTGQKQLPRESCAKCHTIAYVDILAQELNEKSTSQKKWRSRITFAKIASMPQREALKKSSSSDPSSTDCACPYVGPVANSKKPEGEELPPPGRCCRGPAGELGEAISIRKDMSFLEQMFIRAHNLRKINDYYEKLQSMGMYMLMKPPKLAPSQYFRQSKLAHCLKDIVSGKTVIRLILHVRPEQAYLQSTLEVMRFSERARCIPCDFPKKPETNKAQSFEEKIALMCQELGIPGAVTNSKNGKKGSVELTDLYGHISPDKMKDILQEATNYFEEKLDSLEGACKKQVKGMFETFRRMWNHMLEKESLLHEESPQRGADAQDVTGTQTEGGEALEGREKEKEHIKRKSKDKVDNHKKKKGVRRSSKQVKSRSHNASVSKASEPDENRSKKPSTVGSLTQGDEGEPIGEDSDEMIPVNRTSLNDNKPAEPDEPAAATAPAVVAPPIEEQKPTPEPIANIPEVTPVKNTSISVPPGNVPVDKNANPDPINFKQDAWNRFSKSEIGSLVLTKFAEKQTALRQGILDHNEAQKEVSTLVAGLTQLEINLDIMEQERNLQGNVYDAAGKPKVSLQEQTAAQEINAIERTQEALMFRLQNLRSDIQSQKSQVVTSKKECEVAFHTYCMQTFGKFPDLNDLPLSTLDHAMASTAQATLGFPKMEPTSDEAVPGEITPEMIAAQKEIAISKHFDNLKRIAQQQVHILLQAYPKRPPWSTY